MPPRKESSEAVAERSDLGEGGAVIPDYDRLSIIGISYLVGAPRRDAGPIIRVGSLRQAAHNSPKGIGQGEGGVGDAWPEPRMILSHATSSFRERELC